VQAVGDAELELWAAHRQAGALEEALERKVTLEKVAYRKGLRAVNTELARKPAQQAPARNKDRRRSA
jgi:hypothetical protein